MSFKKLARARQAKGYSLRQLAEQVGVSAMVISKYERGVINPSAKVLAKLLSALGVSESYLLDEVQIELTDIEYRTLHDLDLPLVQKGRIAADVTRQLEVRLECEAVLPTLKPGQLTLPRLPRNIQSYDEIEAIAGSVRKSWGLALYPIKNMIVLLEDHGFRIFSSPFGAIDRFDGFSALCDDMPIIVTGKGWHGDRQRFTLAHELGHFVMKGRLSQKLDEETACHRFAAAFLAPAAEVLRILGDERASLITRYELYMLKHAWGISMQAWVFRALHLGIINESQRQAQWRLAVGKNFKTEPGEQYPAEQPFHLYLAVARALSEKLIDPAVAADFLGVEEALLDSLLEMQISSSQP